MEFDIPDRIEFSIDESTIVPSNDPAAAFGYASTAQISIIAFFSLGRYLDITTDSRVSFTLSNSTIVSISGNQISIIGSDNGQVTISVSYDFYGMGTFTATDTITVARSVDITLQFSPYPQFSGSHSLYINSSQIYPRTTIRQNLMLNTKLVLSNRDKILITPNATHSVSNTSLVRIDESVLKPLLSGLVNIEAQYASFSDSKMLDITDNSLDIIEFNIRPDTLVGSTLSGLKGSSVSTAGDAIFRDSFNNDLIFPELFPNGVPTLPGLLTFQSDDPNTISINANTGEITLQQNSIENMVTLTANGPAGVSDRQVLLYSNLEPELGDFDFGSDTGRPVPPLTVSCHISAL